MARPISLIVLIMVILFVLAFETWVLLRVAKALAVLCGEPLSRALVDTRCF